MKPHCWRPTAWLTGLTLLGVAGCAQVWADDNLYRVEIIIFQQEDIGSESPERWPTHPEPAAFARYAELRENVDTPDDDLYRLLADDDLGLRGTARRLDNSNAYQVLVHTAWIQPGLDRNESAAVRLPLEADTREELDDDEDDDETDAENGADNDDENDNGDDANDEVHANGELLNEDTEEIAAVPSLDTRPPEGLSGWIRVSQDRYLHVHTDLRWLNPQPEPPAQRDGMREFWLEEMEPVVVMRAHRRMRRGELHYIDHPLLGVLIHVDRVEE
ncbi:CsiV family protein [Aquisalimonas sp.]|uniref:CsiV family protein n=1 Tax=Aquisalimonas sp. TaxID=1872621 RepID=UPI0025B9B7E0|nr:CsiV family protein [Aquisalimonas sp.]